MEYSRPSLSILPEHAVPEAAAACTACELGGRRSRVVWGEGRPGAPIMVLLDNPGAREDAGGSPFLCGTRQTMQTLVIEAGLGLEDIYVTFVVKCRPRRAYDKRRARATCLAYFRQQLAEHRPAAIVCLGDVAVQALFGEAAQAKSLRGRWHQWHGFAVGVSYHPLAVRRRPNLFPVALQDWMMVAAKIT